MKPLPTILIMAIAAAAPLPVWAQVKPTAAPAAEEPRRGHEPPPQAYSDCAGKKAGEVVQHTTPQGKVTATCEDSPKGLVARPRRPGNASGASSAAR
ncbi:MAG TPA: hypothetical protein PLA97_13245 [Rubrivivax sp.]|nr:hypothetical protein [Rubrivivax sp.]